MATTVKTKKTLDELQAECEVAEEVLSEGFAYFAKQLAAEEEKECPNPDKISTLEAELSRLNKLKMELSVESIELINRALYVLAPLLRKE